MSKRKKVKAPAGGDWFATAVEVPRPGTPDAHLRRSKTNRWRLAVLASLVLSPLAIGSALSAAFSAQAPATSSSDGTNQATAPGRALATRELVTFLSSDGQVILDASAPVWAGATQLANRTDSDEGVIEVWVHTFEITSPDRAYLAYVTIGQNENGQGALIGAPHLATTSLAAQEMSFDLWPGTHTITAPAPVSDAVKAWATAYANDDSALLRMATGDNDVAHGYEGLGSVSLVSANLSQVSELAASGGRFDPANVLAALTLEVRGVCAAPDSQSVSIAFDLLIGAANTANPHILAWGPPGSGPNLSPYQNAVSAETITDAAPLNCPPPPKEPEPIPAPTVTITEIAPAPAPVSPPMEPAPIEVASSEGGLDEEVGD